MPVNWRDKCGSDHQYRIRFRAGSPTGGWTGYQVITVHEDWLTSMNWAHDPKWPYFGVAGYGYTYKWQVKACNKKGGAISCSSYNTPQTFYTVGYVSGQVRYDENEVCGGSGSGMGGGLYIQNLNTNGRIANVASNGTYGAYVPLPGTGPMMTVMIPIGMLGWAPAAYKCTEACGS